MSSMSRFASGTLRPGLCCVLFALLLSPSADAKADVDDWTDVREFAGSPEHFGAELRVGVFYPEGLGSDFSSSDYFGDDVGPMLGLEMHYFPFRIPYLGPLGAGFGFGWSQWDTNSPGGGDESERNVFEVIGMRPFLLWRIDGLSRHLNVPLVLTPKFGMDAVHWLTSSGGQTEAEGWSVGMRFAGKVSLELDFLERRGARQLDEEWGINHSELFAEFYMSTAGEPAGGMLPLNGWGWTAGLGLTF